MSEEDLALVRRSMDLFIEGDRDAGWGLWAEDCVGYPAPDWPEPGPFRGRDALRGIFDSWNSVFGSEWTSHMNVLRMHDLGEGRVLILLDFKPSGARSGLPVDQELAAIWTVRDGEVVRGDFFMGHDEARQAAGVE